jgi:hypothetical protein
MIRIITIVMTVFYHKQKINEQITLLKNAKAIVIYCIVLGDYVHLLTKKLQ